MLKNDLNLLAVFDVLYELKSVTQTARRLNLTQSAVSHALRRLRQTVDDPLFVRIGGKLQPTARARAMADPVREGLARLRAATLPLQFDAGSSERTFTVATTSYFCAWLIPELIAASRIEAPDITIRTLPVYPELLAHVDEGLVDLALGSFSRLPARFMVEPLFSEDLVWIAARHNPILKKRLSHAQLLAQPHVALEPIRTFRPTRPRLADRGFEDRLSAELSIPIEMHGSDLTPAVVYDTLTAIAVVARTDLIALVPRRLATIEGERHGVLIVETDSATTGVDLVMISGERSFPDAGLNWLRTRVSQLAVPYPQNP